MRLPFPPLRRFAVVATAAPLALGVAFAIVASSGMVACSQGTVALPLYEGGALSDVTTTTDSPSEAESDTGAAEAAVDAAADGAAKDGEAKEASTGGASDAAADGPTDGSPGDSGTGTSDANDQGG